MSWPMTQIGRFTHVVTKGTTPTKKQGFADSGINYIKAEALNGDSSLDLSGGFYISEDVHQSLKRSILEEGDLLLTIAGANIGKCGIVEDRHLPANTNQAVGIIRVDQQQVATRFLCYWFKQPQMFRYIQGLNAQAAQPNINLSMLRNIEVPVPPMSEQQSIANILSAYDELIENNCRRIQLLEQAARLLYKEWFVHLRFPGHEHVKVVEGVPEGWERVVIRDVADVNRTSLKNTYQGEIEYIDIAAVSTGSIDKTTLYQFEDAPGRARRVVQHGDIIWSCVRPNRQSHAVIWQPPPNWIASTGFAVISPRVVPTSFLYQAVTTADFVGYLSNKARGVAYPAVTGKDFEEAPITVPPLTLLRQFDSLMSPSLAQGHILHQQNQNLAQARDLLLPRLMNGEIAV